MCASEITGGSDGDDWRMMNGQLMGEYGWWWRWWSKWWSGWWWCCMVNCDEWWVIQPQHHSPQFIAVAPMNPGFHSRAYIRRTSTTRLERDCGKFGNNRRQRRFGSVVVGPIFVVFPCQQQNHYWHTACLKSIQKVDHMCSFLQLWWNYQALWVPIPNNPEWNINLYNMFLVCHGK